MSLRALSSAIFFAVFGVASSDLCMGRLHDLCRLYTAELNCMGANCWGYDSRSEPPKISPQTSPEEPIVDGVPEQWLATQSYRDLGRFDLFFSTSALRTNWNWNHPRQSEIYVAVENRSDRPQGDPIDLDQIHATRNSDCVVKDNSTMNVQWLDDLKFSLIETREFRSGARTDSALLSGWEWFIRDLGHRIQLHRFMKQSLTLSSEWSTLFNSLVLTALDKGLEVVADTQLGLTTKASSDETIVKETVHSPSLQYEQSFSEYLAAAPFFVIYQKSGKDFLVPRRITDHWSVVPEFGSADRELTADEASLLTQPQEKNVEQREHGADQLIPLDRALQLFAARQLEEAAGHLLFVAQSLKQRASVASGESSTEQVASSESFETKK